MKKVGFVIPSFMYEILVGDMEYFRLKLGELGNKILSYYLGKTILGKLDFKTNSSERVQFNLSKTNEKILEQLKKEKKLEKEGEYFRNIYFTYINNLRYIRERIIFNRNFEDIENAIKFNRKIIIEYHSKIRTVNPYHICIANKEERSYLFCYCEVANDYRAFRVSEIKDIKILDIELERKDSLYIKNVKESFDPFLSFNKKVKVRFTKRGVKRYEKALVNRPRLISKENDIYTFQCSEKMAKVYFPQFYAEVEILEPISLREELKKDFQKILDLYK